MKESGVIKLSTIIVIISIIIIIIGTAIYMIFLNKQEHDQLLKEPSTSRSGELEKENRIDIKVEDQNSIKIRYAYAYDMTTAERLNEDKHYIDILEIDVTGEKLEKLNQLIENISFEPIDPTQFYKYNMRIGVAGMYELTINNEMVLLIDEIEYALCKESGNQYFIKVTKEFVEEVNRIVQEEANKQYKKFSSEKIVIVPEQTEGLDVIITNEKHVKLLTENLKYAKVNISEDEIKDEEIEYTVDLGNGVKVAVYRVGALGQVIDNTEKYYVAFVTEYEEIVSRMYENYESGRNEEIKANEILAKYKGKEYKVTDREKIDSIIDKLITECQYMNHDFLKNYKESQFGDEDIIIQLENSKIVIPGDRTIGNRYYIDRLGKVWMISGLSEVETYFKALVEYTAN